MEKKFCINCGEELEEGARFCWKCGTEQRAATCPSCGQQIKAGWKVCPFCGAALSADTPSGNSGWSEKRAPSVGSTITFGAYDWRVLEVKNGKALLIAQDVTHINMPYNEELVDVTWETCTLRKWLNEEFFYSFTKEEQRQIAPTANINENNQWYSINGGRNTQDRIFLLSISEVVKYSGDSGDLKNRKGWYWEGDKWILKDSKGYAINDQFNQKRIAKYNGSEACWWLRSPGYYSIYAALVLTDGLVNLGGYDVDFVSVYGGVRPVLWLNL
jgi:hypothetical protein